MKGGDHAVTLFIQFLGKREAIVDEILISKWPGLPGRLAGEIIKQILKRGVLLMWPQSGSKLNATPEGGWHALHVSWEGVAETQGCMHALEPSPVSHPSLMPPRHLDGVSWRGAVLRSPPQPVPLFLSSAPVPHCKCVFMCSIHLETKGSMNACRTMLGPDFKECLETFAVYFRILS